MFFRYSEAEHTKNLQVISQRALKRTGTNTTSQGKYSPPTTAQMTITQAHSFHNKYVHQCFTGTTLFM